MSVAQWAELDDDERCELVEGALVEPEMPAFLHDLVVTWLGQVLVTWAASRGALVAGSGVKLGLAPGRGRIPDLIVYLGGARRPPLKGLVDVPPSIVVEVVMPDPRDQRRDRVEKVADYAAFGIPWYWLVDPELRAFEILELGADGRYAHAASATEGVMDRVPSCEGLAIDVGALWAAVDALVKEVAVERV
jgi:Uma2 family endonuclease